MQKVDIGAERDLNSSTIFFSLPNDEWLKTIKYPFAKSVKFVDKVVRRASNGDYFNEKL